MGRASLPRCQSGSAELVEGLGEFRRVGSNGFTHRRDSQFVQLAHSIDIPLQRGTYVVILEFDCRLEAAGSEHGAGRLHTFFEIGAGQRNDDAGSSFERILLDRKSTRLNSSHVKISYAAFCLKKKRHST